MITAIITVYNGESFIERSFRSVINQTDKDFEFIVVDNGSTDNTPNLIKSLVKEAKDQNIRVFTLEKNKGISGGRNHGVRNAHGDFVCFLDCDDYWLPNKIEVVKKNIALHPDCDVFCHWEIHDNGERRLLAQYRQINNNDAFYDLIVHGNCLSTSAMIIKRDVFESVDGFDENLCSGEEDYDCWLKLAYCGARFYMIEQELGVWTIREDSVSSKYIQHTEAVLNVLNNHISKLKLSAHKKRAIRKRRFSSYWFACGRQLSKHNDRKNGNALYRRSIKYCWANPKPYVGIALNIIRK